MHYFYLVLALTFVGTNITIGKLIVENVPVSLFSMLRFLIGTVILFVLNHFVFKHDIKIKSAVKKNLFLQAMFGSFLFSVFILYGVQYTNAVNAGIITSLTSAITALIAFLVLKEKIDKRKGFSICLAIIGILMLTLESSTGSSSIVGDTLVFLAVCCEACFVVLSRKSALQVPPVVIAYWVNLFSFLLFIPFAISELEFFIQIDLNSLLLIIYYAVTASVIAFLLWYKGISKVSANVAGLFTAVIPLTALISSVIILKEHVFIHQFLGGIFIIGSIFVGTKIITLKKVTVSKSQT